MIEVALFTARLCGPLAWLALAYILLPAGCPLLLLTRLLAKKGIPARSGAIATVAALPYALPVQLVPGGAYLVVAMWAVLVLPAASIYVAFMPEEPRARPWEVCLMALPYLLTIPLSQVETGHHPIG